MKMNLVVSGIVANIFAATEPKIQTLTFAPVLDTREGETSAIPPFAQLILREVDSRHAPKLGDTLVLELNPPQPELPADPETSVPNNGI